MRRLRVLAPLLILSIFVSFAPAARAATLAEAKAQLEAGDTTRSHETALAIARDPASPPAAAEAAAFLALQSLDAARASDPLLAEAAAFHQIYPLSIQRPAVMAMEAAALRRLGRFDEAHQRLLDLAAQYPQSPQAKRAQLDALDVLFEAERYRDYVAAVDVRRKTVPADAELLMRQALACLRVNELSHARAILTELLETFPDCPMREDAAYHKLHCLWGLRRGADYNAEAALFRAAYPGSKFIEDIDYHEALFELIRENWLEAANRLLAFDEKYPQSRLSEAALQFAGRALKRLRADNSYPPGSLEAQEAELAIELLENFVLRVTEDLEAQQVRFDDPALDWEKRDILRRRGIDRLGALFELGKTKELVTAADWFLAQNQPRDDYWLEAIMWKGVAQSSEPGRDINAAAATFDSVINAPPLKMGELGREKFHCILYWRFMLTFERKEHELGLELQRRMSELEAPQK